MKLPIINDNGPGGTVYKKARINQTKYSFRVNFMSKIYSYFKSPNVATDLLWSVEEGDTLNIPIKYSTF
jgi:hypothetical protein